MQRAGVHSWSAPINPAAYARCHPWTFLLHVCCFASPQGTSDILFYPKQTLIVFPSTFASRHFHLLPWHGFLLTCPPTNLSVFDSHLEISSTSEGQNSCMVNSEQNGQSERKRVGTLSNASYLHKLTYFPQQRAVCAWHVYQEIRHLSTLP